MIARSLRQLRTWAPPISIGIIVGAGAFLAAERLDPPRAPQPAPVTYASPAPTRVVYVAQPEQAAQSLQIAGYANCDAARAVGAAPNIATNPATTFTSTAIATASPVSSYPR